MKSLFIVVMVLLCGACSAIEATTEELACGWHDAGAELVPTCVARSPSCAGACEPKCTGSAERKVR
jgi:hypothetical protein